MNLLEDYTLFISSLSMQIWNVTTLNQIVLMYLGRFIGFKKDYSEQKLLV